MSRFFKFGKFTLFNNGRNGMKKLVTLLLSLALVLSLAACGGEATPDASDDAPASSQNEESTENDNTENQIVFEEVVAIDNAECAVKITEIDPDNMWGYTLKAQLENKSTDHRENLYVLCRECFHQWCSVRSNVCKRGSCWQKG